MIAFNDAWVMSAWGKANGIKGDDIVSHKDSDFLLLGKRETKLPKLFMTDADTKFSKKIGWTKGERTGRYAFIIDQ